MKGGKSRRQGKGRGRGDETRRGMGSVHLCFKVKVMNGKDYEVEGCKYVFRVRVSVREKVKTSEIPLSYMEKMYYNGIQGSKKCISVMDCDDSKFDIF